jgi:rhodanese-related sulfurtransferase
MIVLLIANSVSAAEFPLRAKYPNVKPIALEKLFADYDSTIIIDVRSKMEFDVVHVAKAKHVQVTKGNFLTELKKVRAKNDDTNIAFYCNGHTCAKSYKASIKAMDAGFKNIYCFDAGIFEWVNAYPERGVLLGQTPADKTKLIAKADLNSKKLSWADYKAKAANSNAVIIDTRDPFQRAKGSDLDQNKAVVLKNIRTIPMDRMVNVLKKGDFKNKQLLIFDAVGKQVRWLQYYLEEYGYENYAFLNKGVLAAAKAGEVK